MSTDPCAWIQWRTEWDVVAPGDYMLACRATDEAGHVQPLDPQACWNRQGMGVNGVQHVPMTVSAGIGSAGNWVPSIAEMVLPGAQLPPMPNVENSMARP